MSDTLESDSAAHKAWEERRKQFEEHRKLVNRATGKTALFLATRFDKRSNEVFVPEEPEEVVALANSFGLTAQEADLPRFLRHARVSPEQFEVARIAVEASARLIDPERPFYPPEPLPQA